MNRIVLIAGLLLFGLGCATPKTRELTWKDNRSDQSVTIETTQGQMTVNLLLKESPLACAVFLRAVERGFYTNRAFKNNQSNRYYSLLPMTLTAKEWNVQYRDMVRNVPFSRGTIGMIGPTRASLMNSKGGIFICTRVLDEPNMLNGHYTAFAQVVEGLDVIDKLQEGDTIVRITAPALNDLLADP